jgi:hypothetical protein
LREASSSFLKKRTKKLLSWGQGPWKQRGFREQKFFAELFYKKATAYFVATKKVVDTGLRRHDGVRAAVPT